MTERTVRSPSVGVIGLGYVGLPLLLAFRQAGLYTVGVDTDPLKIEALQAGRSYLHHIPDQALAPLADGSAFAVDPALLEEVEAVIIAVPTPLKEPVAPGIEPEPDLSYIVNTARALGPHLQAGQLVSLESTTWPGTTREVLIPPLEASSGLKAGEDFLVAFSPERVDPGNPRFAITDIPKIVSGLDASSLERAVALYAHVTPRIVPVSTLETAEMAKLLENIYRTVNIALVNELKLLTHTMGLDIWEVVAAAATKPFGFQPFYPGPGLGGHCLPIDPFYLSWRARHHYGFETRFINLAGEVNSWMPHYVFERTEQAIIQQGGSLEHSRVLLLGMAYKKDIGDTRESPGLHLMQLFEERGTARVDYHDPLVSQLPRTRDFPAFAGRSSVPLTPETLTAAAAVIIVTDHTEVDYAAVGEHARLVVDTRNIMRGVRMSGQLVQA
jgi:UDP-N-acetyl-D-glucosamine dehydrogenase